MLLVANIYGWTNGHTDAQARARTDDMLAMIFREFSQLPQGPKLITGDINAGISNLPSLE
eukprot:3137418-Karenia_brevis.AAC.1